MRAGFGRFLLPAMLLLIAAGSLPVSAVIPASNGGGAPLSPGGSGTINYDTYSSICTGSGAGGSIPSPNFGTTLGITLVALDVAFDIIAIGYIVGRVFRHSGVLNWVQGEYYELTKSVFLVVAIYAIITIVSGMAIALAPSVHGSGSTGDLNVGTLITSSEQYLCTAEQNVLPGWGFVGQAAIAIGFVQGTHVLLYLPLPLPIPFTPGFSVNSGFDMAPYQNYMLESGNIVIQHFESLVFDLVQFVLFPVTAMLDVLITLLPVMVALGLTVFVPMGLVMRAFPFIRGVGGTLIAIGIASSIIFPATLVLLDQPVAAWAAGVIPPTETQPAGVCGGGTIICNTFVSILNTLIPSSEIATNGQFPQLVSYAWDSFSGIYVFMNGMVTAGWYVTIQLILFALDLIIIYPLTDSIAKMLGGTIRLSLGGKFRLA